MRNFTQSIALMIMISITYGISTAQATAVSFADSFFSATIEGASFEPASGFGSANVFNSASTINDEYFGVPASLDATDSAFNFASSEFDTDFGSNTISIQRTDPGTISADSFQSITLPFTLQNDGDVSIFVDYLLTASSETSSFGESVNAFAEIAAYVEDTYLDEIISAELVDSIASDAVDGAVENSDALDFFSFSFFDLLAGDYALIIDASVFGAASIDPPVVVPAPATIFLFAAGLLFLLRNARPKNDLATLAV